MTKHNLNDKIRFKLTDRGKEFIRELNRTDIIYKRIPIKFKTDDKGWSEDNMWHLMSIIGSGLSMGSELLIETEFYLIPA